MSQKRTKAKGRREGHSFAGIPHAVIKTKKYAGLSAWAVKLLLDVTAQFNGRNNGDLQASWSCLREQGWRSKGTLDAALKELEAVGFIVRTRQGGRHKCSLFGVTWAPIDDCLDKRTKLSKIDVSPTSVAPGTWKDTDEN